MSGADFVKRRKGGFKYSDLPNYFVDKGLECWQKEM